MTGIRSLAVLAGGFMLATATAAAPLAAQEPAPIQAGVAPAPGPYAPGVDVLHYEVELALEEGSDRFLAAVEIDIAVRSHRAILPLDLTGLEITGLALDGRTVPYVYEEGVVRVPLGGAVPGDTVRVALT